jgi:glycosyltransferase involved in cell wall biosynthesis
MSASDRTRVQRITVVTACKNAVRHIGETVESVLSQTAIASGRVDLEYLIVDGMSSDGTLEAVARIRTPAITLVSETDSGLYEAVAKGLQRATGDVVSYINAGDYYHVTAFDTVCDVMEELGTAWLTGLNVLYTDKSQVVSAGLPYRYRREFLRSGLYNGRDLPFVQQESTFWRRWLHESIDFDRLRQLKYAGDAYLWSCFAEAAELEIVSAYLGGFRVHTGQLSESKAAYVAELRTLFPRARLLRRLRAWLDKPLWHAPAAVKKGLNKRLLHRFDFNVQRWD